MIFAIGLFCLFLIVVVFVGGCLDILFGDGKPECPKWDP